MKPVSILGGDISGPQKLSKMGGGTEVFKNPQQEYKVRDEISQLKREYEKILKRVQEGKKRSLAQGDFEVVVRETLARLATVGITNNTEIQQEIERLRKEISEKKK